MADLSRETQSNVEVFTSVMDIQGWSLSMMSVDAFSVVKNLTIIDSNFYPERLGTMVSRNLYIN